MKTLFLATFIFTFFFVTRASSATTLQAELISISTSVNGFSDHDEGIFQIRVRLTAIGGDVYIIPHPLTPSGFLMSVYKNGSPTGSSYITTVDNISSSTNVILEGESHIFQTTTSVIPISTGLYSVGIAEIMWQGESSTGESTYGPLVLGMSYLTSSISLRASSSVPEPSRIVFLGFGFILTAFRRRRK